MRRGLLGLLLLSLLLCFVSCGNAARFYAGDVLSAEEMIALCEDLLSEEKVSVETPPNAEEVTPENEMPSAVECYFVAGSGEVYHTRADCSYLKNSKNVTGGTLAEASAAGKTRLCSACGKAESEEEERIEASFTEEELQRICYFVSGGSVWHYDENCSALSHSKEILNGSVADAIAAGKTRACARCGD